MNICLVTRCLTDGGTEKVAASLASIWSDSGDDVTLLTYKPPSDTDFACKYRRRIVVESSNCATSAIQDCVKHNGLDVVVFNGGWNNDYFNPLVKQSKKLGAKVFVILHHCFNNWAFCRSNCEDFDKEEILSYIDCIVCVDRMQALWWSRIHNAVAYIPNPCSMAPTERPRKNAPQDLIWVGRPKDSGKRVELAAEAFRIFCKTHPEFPNVRLKILGSYDSKVRKSIEDVAGNAVAKRIDLIGYNQDTQSFLCNARIQLVTTLWEVTVPQVILEAQAMGVPTVALSIPVLRQIGVGSGVRLVYDVQEMAELIADCYNEREYQQLCNECSNALACRMSLSSVADAWNSLFRSALDGSIAKAICQMKKTYESVEVYESLIDEVFRGESHFVKHYMSLYGPKETLRIKAGRFLREHGFRR